MTAKPDSDPDSKSSEHTESSEPGRGVTVTRGVTLCSYSSFSSLLLPFLLFLLMLMSSTMSSAAHLSRGGLEPWTMKVTHPPPSPSTPVLLVIVTDDWEHLDHRPSSLMSWTWRMGQTERRNLRTFVFTLIKKDKSWTLLSFLSVRDRNTVVLWGILSGILWRSGCWLKLSRSEIRTCHPSLSTR